VWPISHPLSRTALIYRTDPALDLSWNHIGDEGVANLSSALKNCTNLQNLRLSPLNLSGNDIRDEGLANLSSGLKNCTNLHNTLTDASISALTEIITTSPTLTDLQLWLNGFTEEGESRLMSVVEERNRLSGFRPLNCTIRL
jgi:Ran GTPase-activating protein (RanGAP) involved in mRNA processing and transport